MASPGEGMAGRADDRHAPGSGKTLLKSLAALIFLGALLSAIIYKQSIESKAKVDAPAPPWTVEDLEGRPVALSDFQGRFVLLNLWTTWCIGCKEETPALQSFHERYGDRITVVGLDVREPVRTIRKYMEKTGITFTVLRDPNGSVPDRYNLQAYPESWFIDGEGIARAFWKGPMTFEQMQSLYEAAARKPIDGEGVGPVREGAVLRVAVADPAFSDNIFAGTSQGLFRGSGETWEAVTDDPNPVRGDVRALLLLRNITVLAAGPQFGVVRSSDRGKTWEDAGIGLPSREVLALAAAPAGDVLYAWVSNEGLFRSFNGGASWSVVTSDLPVESPVAALAVDPRDTSRLLLSLAQKGFVGWEGRLLVGEDGGTTFKPLEIRQEIHDIDTRPVVFGIAFDPIRSGTVFFATDKGIWKSDGDGTAATWLEGSHARKFDSVAVGPESDRVLAAAANGDIYLSRDGGGTWELITR